MACGDCAPINPTSCGPYGSLSTLQQIISKLDACCLSTVPVETALSQFLSVGFPDGVDCNCQELWIVNANGVYLSIDEGMSWCNLQSSAQTLYGAQIGFALNSGATMAVPNGIQFDVPFNVVNYDTAGFYTGVPGRLYAPFDGYYDVEGVWTVSNLPANDTGTAVVFVTKNGLAGTAYDLADSYGGGYDPGHVANLIYAHAPRKTIFLEAGDYVSLTLTYLGDTENDGLWAQGNSQNWLSMILRGI